MQAGLATCLQCLSETLSTPHHCLLQDLLSQTSHYSERVRKDALNGMAELLARHPEELRRQVAVAPSKVI